LVAIKGPFSYEALAPEQIEFVPLNQTTKMNGKQLMEFYEVIKLPSLAQIMLV
jgi:phenylalanyl-tRNA synthetase beta chain